MVPTFQSPIFGINKWLRYTNNKVTKNPNHRSGFIFGGEDGSRTRVLFAITISDYTFI